MFFLWYRYDKEHTRGVLGSLSDAHKQTHHLGHKTSFLQVENMWIIGATIWTESECAQKRRYAARINGNRYLLFVTDFLSVVRQKKKQFSGFEHGTKISLAIAASLQHLHTTSLRCHKYYILSYLQTRCVSCRVSLGATHTAMPPVIFAPTT